MADNVQKTPFGAGLNERVRSKVLQHIELMSGRAPASINVKNGKADTDDSHTIAMIKFETDGSFTLPMVQLPIQGSEYSRRPWQGGEKGYVSTADFDIGGMTSLGGTGPAAFVRPGNLSALIFHPLGNIDFSKTDDKDSHVNYGKSGTISRDVGKKSQVKTHPDNGTSASSGGDGSGADGPHSVKTSTTDGVAVASSVAHTIAAPNANLDKTGNLTAKQNIMSSSGNISAPSGNVSGASGSFASGFMGGLSLAGGIMSGGGSPGAPAVSIDTNAGAITARQLKGPIVLITPMTYAALVAAYPASAALLGARATVSDSTTQTFFATLAGGGTKVVPAFCTLTDPVAPSYGWVVG